MTRACAVLLGFIAAGAVQAHEVRPAYLELKEVAAETYTVFWKVPARGADERLALDLRLPDGCRHVDVPGATMDGVAYVERSRVACAGGLDGGAIRVDGLAATLTEVLARVERENGSTQVARLTPDRPSFVVAATPRAMNVVRAYVPLGIEHILTGVDHLLFVLGLLLLVHGVGRLVKTISAFTVAHSVTLTLATLGFVHVSAAPVEAVIALSIVFVAREIVRAADGAPSLARR